MVELARPIEPARPPSSWLGRIELALASSWLDPSSWLEAVRAGSKNRAGSLLVELARPIELVRPESSWLDRNELARWLPLCILALLYAATCCIYVAVATTSVLPTIRMVWRPAPCCPRGVHHIIHTSQTAHLPSSFCIFSTHGGVLYQHAETLSSAHATKVVASGRACIHGMPHTCASRQHPKREVRWSQKRIYIVMPELPKELDGHPPSPSRLVEHTHGMHMYMCLLLLLDLSSMSSCMHCHEGRTSKFHRRPVQSPPPPQLDVPPN